jgi:putative CocE/NonD family hydrolase
MLAFLLPAFGGAPPSNVWQEGLCARADILSFRSDPLNEALHIAGNIEVTLTVASSAKDTAFTAKIVEVFADGREINVRDGISSLALRNGSQHPLAYEPGSELLLLLSLWPIEWEFAAGSRIRLDVSSSDFPKFHAHPNRAGPWAEQTDADVAEQTLIVGGTVESWLDLPVVAASP